MNKILATTLTTLALCLTLALFHDLIFVGNFFNTTFLLVSVVSVFRSIEKGLHYFGDREQEEAV